MQYWGDYRNGACGDGVEMVLKGMGWLRVNDGAHRNRVEIEVYEDGVEIGAYGEGVQMGNVRRGWRWREAVVW